MTVLPARGSTFANGTSKVRHEAGILGYPGTAVDGYSGRLKSHPHIPEFQFQMVACDLINGSRADGHEDRMPLSISSTAACSAGRAKASAWDVP